MRRLDEVRKEIATYVSGYIRSDGCLPEADEAFNNKQRELVKIMAEQHGEAWLAKQWKYASDTFNAKERGVLWLWDGGTVYNFEAEYVLPCFDVSFVTLIEASREATGHAIRDALDKVYVRLRELGGHHLVWT